MPRPGEDLLHVEDTPWMLVAPTGQGIYDFPFDRLFACRRPYLLPEEALSIIEGPDAFRGAMEVYASDSILRWQRVVCRELRPLRRVEEGAPDRIPSSFGFRTFWWHGELVGWGHYWWQGSPYAPDAVEERDIRGGGGGGPAARAALPRRGRGAGGHGPLARHRVQ